MTYRFKSESPQWMLYNGKNQEVFPLIEQESVDLIITSPPYDNIRDYTGFEWDIEAVANGAWQCLKRGGVMVWVVADQTVDGSETGSSFRQALTFMAHGFRLHDTMIWDRGSTKYPDKVRYSNHFQYMFILSKGKPKTVNLIADKPNRYPGTKITGTERQRDGSLKMRTKEPNLRKKIGVRGNIWYCPAGFGRSTRDKVAYDHPAIFPEAIAKDHILSWSNPGDVVLDPFAGSGTTLKMAVQAGRKAIGIEMSDQYCNIILNRMEGVKPE